jgi:hypothetical protein
MRLAIFEINTDRLLQQPNCLIAAPALHFGDAHELERIGMARLTFEDSLIGRHRLPDAAVAVQLDGVPHHFAQFRIRAARRRGAGLRFAASALFSVHLISVLPARVSPARRTCNLA